MSIASLDWCFGIGGMWHVPTGNHLDIILSHPRGTNVVEQSGGSSLTMSLLAQYRDVGQRRSREGRPTLLCPMQGAALPQSGTQLVAISPVQHSRRQVCIYRSEKARCSYQSPVSKAPYGLTLLLRYRRLCLDSKCLGILLEACRFIERVELRTCRTPNT